MSRFDDWFRDWNGSDVKCENPDVRGSWNEQQKRIDELKSFFDDQDHDTRIGDIWHELQELLK